VEGEILTARHEGQRVTRQLQARHACHAQWTAGPEEGDFPGMLARLGDAV
jgi:hypothetical protein